MPSSRRPRDSSSRLAEAEAGTSPRLRTAVTQAENDVLSSEEGLTVVKSQRKPAVSLNSVFGIVQYPSAVPNFDDWRTNWTVGAAVSMPILTGGRIKAEEIAARADIDESKARLQLAKELADLDTASAARGAAGGARGMGSEAAARFSRRSAPTRSPICAIARDSRRSSSSPTRGSSWRRRSSIVRERRATCR